MYESNKQHKEDFALEYFGRKTFNALFKYIDKGDFDNMIPKEKKA